MAAPFASKQTYINEFNPKEYLQTYYEAKDGQFFGECTDFILRNLHETFTKGGVKGETLLDFGTGPTIYQLLSACEVFDKIIVSDFLVQNCNEFQKWLKKDQDAFDWTHIIKSVCDLEGNKEDCEKKSEKLRSKVKEVLKCDALKRNPFDPIVVPPVDCLLSCLCLEAACKDIKSFCEVLKNFKDLIKPGGHLIISSALNGLNQHDKLSSRDLSAEITTKAHLTSHPPILSCCCRMCPYYCTCCVVQKQMLPHTLIQPVSFGTPEDDVPIVQMFSHSLIQPDSSVSPKDEIPIVQMFPHPLIQPTSSFSPKDEIPIVQMFPHPLIQPASSVSPKDEIPIVQMFPHPLIQPASSFSPKDEIPIAQMFPHSLIQPASSVSPRDEIPIVQMFLHPLIQPASSVSPKDEIPIVQMFPHSLIQSASSVSPEDDVPGVP